MLNGSFLHGIVFPTLAEAITAEVLMSAGDREDVSLEHLIKMHQLIPKSHLAIFPNTEYTLLLKQPDKMLSPIREVINNDQ